ncbi:MAG TPA: cation:proton antiporter, partial [bacterium]|nr:cation:proton antiporter [bacterium]
MKLPNILGMLLCGILLGVYFKNAIPQTIWDIEPILKSLALIIIILRAGLSIKKDNLAQIGNTAITMSILPCLIEGAALIFIFRFFFQFEWISAGMAAFIISAVSPAVVVPAMIEIKEKNPSENKVPTLMLASASVDNVAAITIFSLFLNIHQSKSIDITKILLTIPLSILSGIGFGVILGFALVVYFEKKY